MSDTNPNPWNEYQPSHERDKEFYDIELRDGTIVFCCYPNGIHWNPWILKANTLFPNKWEEDQSQITEW